MRRARGEGAFATVARKGDPDAGAVAVKVFLRPGAALLFVQSRDLEGKVIWRNPFEEDAQDDASEQRVDEWLAKETAIDPDLWIVEIEDKDGRAFLE